MLGNAKEYISQLMAPGGMVLKLASILIAVIVFESVLLLVPGHLAINGHEVDVLHATEAAIRLSVGQAQHVDFLTPLGVLAFAPIALFLNFGFGIATANIAASILMACLFLPFLIWIGSRRFDDWLGIAFGIVTLIMVTAVVYGGDNPTVSMSMYYNRWGWAAVFIIAAILIIPNQSPVRMPRSEGAVIGLMLGYLLLLKATFFVALAPAVALIFLINRNWSGLIACLVAGFLVCALATVAFGGVEFWRSYLSDLLLVSSSEVRPRPGKEFAEVLALPNFFPGTMCLLAAIIGLRISGYNKAGLTLFLLAPGFAYVTYQNWGNDTKWLVPLGFACLLWSRSMDGKRVYGWDARTYFTVLGATSLALITPSIINMASSPIRNFVANNDEYVSMLHDPNHAGLIIERKRSYLADASVSIDGVTDPDPTQGENDEKMQERRLGDFEIPKCTLKTGYYGLMQIVADDLIDAGYGDTTFAFVDVANPLPLLAPLKRLQYASPWYYGGTRDTEEAEVLIVPKCPVSQPTFVAYLKALNASETKWELAETRAHVWIFKRR